MKALEGMHRSFPACATKEVFCIFDFATQISNLHVTVKICRFFTKPNNYKFFKKKIFTAFQSKFNVVSCVQKSKW